MLDDYAAMARAALSLFEATGEPDYLSAATRWAEAATDPVRRRGRRLRPDRARCAWTASSCDRAQPMTARRRPAPRVMAEVFARLHLLTDEARWREAAERLIRAATGAREALARIPLLLAAADLMERGAVHRRRRAAGPSRRRCARASRARRAGPGDWRLRIDPARWPHGAPGGRPSLGVAPAAMFCRGQTRSLPVTTADALRDLLAARLEAGALEDFVILLSPRAVLLSSPGNAPPRRTRNSAQGLDARLVFRALFSPGFRQKGRGVIAEPASGDAGSRRLGDEGRPRGEVVGGDFPRQRRISATHLALNAAFCAGSPSTSD